MVTAYLINSCSLTFQILIMVTLEPKFRRALSNTTLYPEKSERLPKTGMIKLPRKYEKLRQISNGSFTSVFCIKDRGKTGSVLAAKFMKDNLKNDNQEVEILRRLQNCERVPKIVDVIHSDYQTILVTDYFAGKCSSSAKHENHYLVN